MCGKESRNSKLATAFYIYFNLALSTTIILLNKWVYVHIGFPNLTLTFFHFLTTFIGLNICERLNVFQVKVVPLREVFLLSTTFCGFVIFTNLSLQYNTVGTYQLAKVMTTPLVIVLQMFIYNKKYSLQVKCTLVPIIVGVFLNFYYDLKFNILGTFFAVCGFCVTSLYQIVSSIKEDVLRPQPLQLCLICPLCLQLVSAKQHELQMDPVQLLYYQTPLSCIMLLIFVFCFEPPFVTLVHRWTLLEIAMVFFSCVVAFFLNISIYWLIGMTSPLTYNMLGHFKFCLSVIGGYIIFNEPLTLMQILGVIMTLSGVTYYAQVKLKENKENEKSSSEV